MRRARRFLLVAAGAALACLVAVMAGADAMEILAESGNGRIALRRGPTTVPLTGPGEPDRPSPGLGERLDSLMPGQHVHLMLQDLRADREPGVVYGVYLDLRDGTPPGTDATGHVGDINFFGTRPPGEGRPRSVSFEVTGTLRTLEAAGRLAADTTVTIIPEGQPQPEAHPSIGRIFVALE